MICFVACRGCGAPKPAEPPPPDPTAGLPQAATLEGQLAAEAAARLHDAQTVTLEQLARAIEPEGVSLGPARQALARKQLALYCATADATFGLIVTVCEYPSHAAAVNGEREANVLASKVAGHRSLVRGKSVLHLISPSTAPADKVDRVVAAFLALPDAGT